MLLFILFVLLLSIPSIQTRLGRYVTKKINSDFNTNITIQKLGLQFNGDVELKDIYVEDHKRDTLIYAKTFNTSIISFKKLYNGKLTLGDVDMDKLYFNLKTYKGEHSNNLDVFIEKFGTSKTTSKAPFLLSSSDITFTNSKFILSDENFESSELLNFKNLNINTTNFLVLGTDITARINTLSFFQDKGIALENLQTNFAYSPTKMNFENLSIKTKKSFLNGNLKFSYQLKDLPQFVNKVQLTANFTSSNIALSELNRYYNEFGSKQYVKLKANFSGTLNHLLASNVTLTAASETSVQGDLKFKNIFGKNSFYMEGNYNALSTSTDDLQTLLPKMLNNVFPKQLDSLGRFTIKGNSTLTKTQLDTDIVLNSKLGTLQSKVELQHIDELKKLSYKGNLILEQFNLDKIFPENKLGYASANLNVDGKGFNLKTLNTLVKGNFSSFYYNNYHYSNLALSGNFQDNIFNGQLIAKDPNLDLKFNGLVDFTNTENNYNFTANVGRANLDALNVITKDSISIFKGLVKMNIKGTNIDNAYGRITFKNTQYKNQNEVYNFKDFELSSIFKNDIRYLTINSPDIIEGSLNGKFIFKDALKLLENAIGSIYTNYEAHNIAKEQFMDFNFKVHNKIAEVFLPNLQLADNTFFKGHLETDATKFNLKFNSKYINLNDNQFSNINLTVNNNNPLFNTFLEVGKVDTKYYKVSDFNLINTTQNDTLIVSTAFKGGRTNTDNFDLSLYYTIDSSNTSVVGFKKSKVLFKDNTWYINENKNQFNKVEFDREFKNITFNKINLTHLEEEIALSGVIKDSSYKNINLEFKNVDLIKITPKIDSLALAGNVNGTLQVKQNGGGYLPESNIVIDDFNINNFNFGSFKANIVGRETLTDYDINMSLKDDKHKSLSVIGNVNVSQNNPSINLKVDFDKFILNPLTPFGSGVITNIRGEVEGGIKVSGRLNRPTITGDLNLNKGGLTIPYLNVDYNFADKTIVTLNEQSFNFNNARLTDVAYSSEANLTGRISHVNFTNWDLDLNIDSNRILVLNTQDSEDALYYGTGFVGGDIAIKGPVSELKIDAEVATEQGTVFVIPLNDAETFGTSSFIHFVTPEEKAAKLKGELLGLNNVAGLELGFDLDINQNAEIEIVIDKETGSTIRGRGDGGILMRINTNDKFDMFGDFVINNGNYNFISPGLLKIQKQFKVKQGGTLVWEGDPLDAQINIRALHDGIRANPSVLLDNPTSQSIPVEVEIELTGQLEQPDINFNLNFPTVNSTVKSELDYRLNDNDTKQFQALSLLATGSFKSELNFRSQDAFGLFSDGIKSIINDFLSADNGNFEIGIDYQLGENTPDFQSDDRFVASLSTKISDKILINGDVGIPIGGVSETIVAGNFEIELLLNEDRTLSLKFFNRENNIRTFGEQIGYTQGVGLSYNVEFNNLRELFSKLFRKKAKQNKKENKPVEEEEFSDFVNFKSKKVSKKSKN